METEDFLTGPDFAQWLEQRANADEMMKQVVKNLPDISAPDMPKVISGDIQGSEPVTADLKVEWRNKAIQDLVNPGVEVLHLVEYPDLGDPDSSVRQPDKISADRPSWPTVHAFDLFAPK